MKEFNDVKDYTTITFRPSLENHGLITIAKIYAKKKHLSFNKVLELALIEYINKNDDE